MANLAATVDDILAVSQRNNADVGVTGALMFDAGCFGQILEGDRMQLESTLERIQRDERHGDISVLAFEPITARTFAGWSMGFVGARPTHAAMFERLTATRGFDPSCVTRDSLLGALKTAALEDEAAAGW